MTGPSTWLRAWERAATQPPLERALTLLAAVEPSRTDADLAAYPIGERDGALLQLRAQMFGDAVSAVVDCPQCGVRLDVRFSTADFNQQDADESALTFVLGDREVTLRRVTTADLQAVAPAPSSEALLERAIVSPAAADLPPAREWLDEGASRLQRADPLAHIELAFSCPECGRDWTAPYDVAGFLWQELEAWAARLLREVHVLASAYGWSERDILDLPPARRRRYLELIER
jgi:predicted RNA-binding Zn-ribbon protein involved in translation (DUF1610 family)